MTDSLPDELFERIDPADDSAFYDVPRLVTHVDDATIDALTGYLGEQLNAGDAVADLMSSWISHLPAVELESVACLGMNAEELSSNPRATEWCVHDLNTDPRLPYSDGRFDWVLISFSIQYLVRPLDVFRDISRILKPGGHVLVAMSHRCFPTKAIRAFHVLPPVERIKLVAHYLALTDCYEAAAFIDRSPEEADPLWLVQGRRR